MISNFYFFIFLSTLFLPFSVHAQKEPDSSAKQLFPAQQSFLYQPTVNSEPENDPAWRDHNDHDSASRSDSGSITIGGAFMRSLVIPGWGQRRVGAKTAARNFFVAEVLLWTGFTAFQIYGNWIEDDYKLFAATHAGAQVAGKEDQFFADMSNFISVDEFNQNRLRRRDVEGLYDPVKDFWEWDTDVNRRKYENLFERSEKAYSRALFMVAGVIANHIVSGIHAGWVAHKKSSSPEKGESNAPQFGVAASAEEIRLVARMKF
jgi:hypothetical protein